MFFSAPDGYGDGSDSVSNAAATPPELVTPPFGVGAPPPVAPEEAGADALPLWLWAAVASTVAMIVVAALLVRRRRRLQRARDEEARLQAGSLAMGADGSHDFAILNDLFSAGTEASEELFGVGTPAGMLGQEGLAALAIANRRQSEVDRELNRQQHLLRTGDGASNFTSNFSDTSASSAWDSLPAGLLMEDELFDADEIDAKDEGEAEDLDMESFDMDMESFVIEAEALLENIDLDEVSLEASEKAAMRNRLAEIAEVVRARREARLRGESAAPIPEEQLTTKIAAIRAGLNRIEKQEQQKSANADDGGTWNNDILAQIAAVRFKMRHVERADLSKVRWQNAGGALFATSLARHIKSDIAAKDRSRTRSGSGSIVNPLYQG